MQEFFREVHHLTIFMLQFILLWLILHTGFVLFLSKRDDPFLPLIAFWNFRISLVNGTNSEDLTFLLPVSVTEKYYQRYCRGIIVR